MFIVISTKRKRMEKSLDYARDDRMGGTRDDNGVLEMTGRRGRFSFMKSACSLKIFGLRGFLFYLCSRIINYKQILIWK